MDEIGILLDSLPAEYEPVVQDLLNAQADVSWEHSVHLLKDFRDKQALKNVSVVPEKVFAARHPLSEVICFLCKKKGHVMRDCKLAHHLNSLRETKVVLKRLLMLLGNTDNKADSSWYLDSGAKSYMSFRKELLHQLEDISPVPISLADGSTIYVVGRGYLLFCNTQSDITVEIVDALFVPELALNLLSITKLTEKHFKVLFGKPFTKIFDENDKLIAEASRAGNLFRLNSFVPIIPASANVVKSTDAAN